MRQHLTRAFSEIYILDLHGNSNKREVCPDGSSDKNVFDIKQGTSIAIFVNDGQRSETGRVWHADLYGVRETADKRGGKYPWLFEHDVANTPWKEIFPQSPLYLFKPRREDFAGEYYSGWRMPAVILSNNMGITTGVDAFATSFVCDELRNRILELAGDGGNAALCEKYNLKDTSSFSLSAARTWAKGEKALESIVPIGYRCFDNRFVIYSPSVLARSREDICQHLLAGENQALVTFREIRRPPWVHAFVSDHIATKEYLSTLDNSYLFPLYLYPTKWEGTAQTHLRLEATVWPPGKDGRRPNLAPQFISELEKRLTLPFVSEGNGDLKKTFGPEDVFNYIYAVLHSPTYRTRYAEFLKSDFPHVPLTSDLNAFRSLCGFGAELIALHLLESSKLSRPIARYPVTGPNLVEKGFPKYLAPGEPEPGIDTPLPAGRVYISKPHAKSGAKGQYFEGVPPEVWNFHIGGYQVCEKWLKDRRGRTLIYDDLEHYRKVVTALAETIRLMAEIDAAIPKWPIE
jgi:predicted helicase